MTLCGACVQETILTICWWLYQQKKPLQMPLMQMWGWQQLCFLGWRPSCTVVDSKSAFSQGWSSTMLRMSTSCALIVHFLTSREITMGVIKDGQGKMTLERPSVSFHSDGDILKGFGAPDRLQLLWLQFHEVWIRARNVLFYFSWFQSCTLYFSVLVLQHKKKVSGKKWKREADCDFGVWGQDCNCLLAGTEMLFLDSLLQCQSRTLSRKEASWKTFYFLLSALFISFR